MAGYIFNLDSPKSLELYTMNGVYATKLSTPPGFWRANHEGTFADYATMTEGDNVYFFIKRFIYGIGKLINVGDDCKYLNYQDADIPTSFDYAKVKTQLLWDESEFSVDQRFICLFEPEPHFFLKGVDMDDVLSSNPSSFKMLRTFERLSFIKFDDDENQAFRDVLLKFNQHALNNPQVNINIFDSNFKKKHGEIEKKLKTGDYSVQLGSILSYCADDDYVEHEMALEFGLLYQLQNRDPDTISIFGSWDYLSHQVIASPFKPIAYVDKMDIFGYSFIEKFKPTKSKYLIIELKKDEAQLDNLNQLMKYVDWVKTEYCYGDYSMIRAFLVAYNFSTEVLRERSNIGLRKYTIGMKPAQSLEWTDLTLVKYSYVPSENKLKFEIRV